MIAIYGIKNKVNGKIYIGQSINVKDRFTRHKTHLKHNKHINKYLQRSYNKYGIDNFEFLIIEQCEEFKLSYTEQKWINHYKGQLYNSELFVEDKTGMKNPFYGKNHSKETKEKMRSAKKGKYLGKENPNYGGKNREILKELMQGSKNCNAKLNEDEVIEIKTLLKCGEKHQKIADIFCVARTVITRINNGTRWGHIKLKENIT